MKPAVPCTVTTQTPLKSLSLNWREKELPQRERTKHVHRLHPYLGKFIPQLAEIFLRKYFAPGQTVLDPFSGSGTTLIQANELGIHSYGIDLSKFNVLLGEAKTAQYDLEVAVREVYDILKKVLTAKEQSHDQLPSWKTGTFPPPDLEANGPLSDWFSPQALEGLLAYRSLIDSESYRYKDLLRVILSRSARSARLTTHFNLDFPKGPQTAPYWCYKHSRTCRPTQEAYKFLRRYSADALKRIEQFSHLRTDARINFIHGDSRSVDIPPVDGVITSPPYVGLIDYHEQHAYAYHLLDLEDSRHQEIGPAARGSGRKARQSYKEDIAQVFWNILPSLPADGVMVVVAGDRANLYGGIAELIGVKVEVVIQRQVNRRTGRRNGDFYESIFVWRKGK